MIEYESTPCNKTRREAAEKKNDIGQQQSLVILVAMEGKELITYDGWKKKTNRNATSEMVDSFSSLSLRGWKKKKKIWNGKEEEIFVLVRWLKMPRELRLHAFKVRESHASWPPPASLTYMNSIHWITEQ